LVFFDTRTRDDFFAIFVFIDCGFFANLFAVFVTVRLNSCADFGTEFSAPFLAVPFSPGRGAAAGCYTPFVGSDSQQSSIIAVHGLRGAFCCVRCLGQQFPRGLDCDVASNGGMVERKDGPVLAVEFEALERYFW
jgi:hypothetical protein